MKFLWVDKKVFDGDWTTMALVSTVAPPNDDSVLMHISKPLNDDEIKAIENSVKYSELALSNDEYMLKFAKAIEKAHGIQKSVE